MQFTTKLSECRLHVKLKLHRAVKYMHEFNEMQVEMNVKGLSLKW